jgi:predicted RNA-binding Zn-ribbon protein involved in translation (DUF1610 family)
MGRDWLYDLSRRNQESGAMSKQVMREETERLVKEALERKAITIKQGKTRIESKCAKCGALNRVSAAQGQVRVPYTCRQCGEKQRTF